MSVCCCQKSTALFVSGWLLHSELPKLLGRFYQIPFEDGAT
jgi:hypothetical protein